MATTTNSLAPLFLDTAYVYALVNKRDQWHGSAVVWQRRLAAERRRLITTQLILVEIADGLAAVRFRPQALQIISTLESSHYVEIIPFSPELFSSALDLDRSRQDKDWGLTDCASFIVMRDRGLSEALTIDEHFQQAGFRPLLSETP